MVIQKRLSYLEKTADRERKIWCYKNYQICHQCYRDQKNKENSINCIEKEMRYSEYKEQYGDCNIKKGSYDGKNKTVVVYVPVDRR